MSFTVEKMYMSTGVKKGFYTLMGWGLHRRWGDEWEGPKFYQNLSTDKQKAIEKGEKRAAALGVPFFPDTNFELEEIERKRRETLEEEAQEPIEDVLELLTSTQEEQERAEPSTVQEILQQIAQENSGTLERIIVREGEDEQEVAIRKIKEGASLFLTGSGGVGKSYVIKQAMDDDTLLCAPTGVAARNIGGTTAHSLFSLPISVVGFEDFTIHNMRKEKQQMVREASRIVIDEVGMVRADVFSLIDWKLKRLMGNRLPFGGKQLVCVGDFFQLEPIVRNEDWEAFSEMHGDKKFAFNSPAWNLPMLELTKVRRQSDRRQINMLNHIRKGTERSGEALAQIQKGARKLDKDVPHLCTVNKRADAINRSQLSKIKAKEYTYYGRNDNYEKWADKLPAPLELKLKEGARVVFCANDATNGYNNGMLGKVESLTHHSILVRTDEGDLVSVQKHKWDKYEYKKKGKKFTKDVVGSFTQFPLKLGWAMSVHKSQGMTLDKVALDMGNGAFAHGQLYVALSRAKDLRNISFIRQVDGGSIIVHEEVKEFYKKMRG